MKFARRYSFIIATAGFLCGCLHSVEPGVSLNLDPEEDVEYRTVYEKSSDRVELIRNFETRYIIHATNLTGEFLKSFAIRYQNIYNEPQPILEEAASKSAFFVTLYAAERDFRDLADEQIWNVQLKRGDKLLKPVTVKHLPQKERWRPFFKSVNLWTREYLIVFDSPQHESQAKELVKTADVSLIFANADAKVTINW